MIARSLGVALCMCTLSGCFAHGRIVTMKSELGNDLAAGRTESASQVAEKITELAIRAYGPVDKQTIDIRSDVATIYGCWLHTDEAVRIAETTIADSERVLGRGDARTAPAFGAITQSYLCAHRWADAERATDRLASLCDAPEARQQGHPCGGFLGLRLRTFYRDAGAYRKSAQAYLRLLERPSDPDDERWNAASLTGMGRLYTAGGLYAEAAPYFGKCLELSKSRYERQRPAQEKLWSSATGDVELFAVDAAHWFESQAPACLEDLIDAKRKLGETAEAERLASWQRELWARGPDVEETLSRNVRIADTAWKDDLLTASRAHTLAYYLAGKGRYADAIGVYEQTIRFVERGASPGQQLGRCFHDPFLVNVLLDAGLAYEGAGRLDDAKAAYRRAESTALAEYPPGHETQLEPVARVANVLFGEGAHEEAEREWRRYLALAEKWRGHEHASTALALAALADVLTATGRHAGADASRREAGRIRKQYAGRAAGGNAASVASSLSPVALSPLPR